MSSPSRWGLASIVPHNARAVTINEDDDECMPGFVSDYSSEEDEADESGNDNDSVQGADVKRKKYGPEGP